MPATKLNDIDQYNSYFETLAKNHKDILHVDEDNCHYYLIDVVQMLDDDYRSSMKENSLVVEFFETRPDGANTSQLNDKLRGAFYVIQKPVNSSDRAGVIEALEFSLDTGRQILAKMKDDAKSNLLPGFDIRKSTINKVGPVGEDFYFYRIEFDIDIPANSNYCYDEGKWN